MIGQGLKKVVALKDKKNKKNFTFTKKMGRMHTPGKGISSSALPYRRSAPSWLKVSSAEVDDRICKLAKKGLTPSQIGVVLR